MKNKRHLPQGKLWTQKMKRSLFRGINPPMPFVTLCRPAGIIISCNKVSLTLLLSTFYFLLSVQPAHAVCQVVCPVVVGGALTLLERWGVDNSISGLWIGGALVLSSLITIQWIAKWRKHWLIDVLTFVAFYASTLIPLYMKHIIGDPSKELWGIDKTLLGIIIGTIFFYLGDWAYVKIKAANGGHAWFPFQKSVMPVVPLAIFSAVFYYITK